MAIIGLRPWSFEGTPQIIVPATLGTLNPSDKHASITLSNGNLTATKTTLGTQWVGARSQTSHSSGKWYYEWIPNVFTSSFVGAGFANSSAALANYFGADTNGISIITDGGVYKNGSGGIAALGALSAGDVIGLAVDIGGNKFWCRRGAGSWNGSGTDNPATGSGGITLATSMTGAILAGLSLQFSSGTQDQGTANFGATSFANGPPAGFSAWG